MKYEKTDFFESMDELDRLIEEAIDDVEDTETEEFLCADDNGAEPSEALDRRIQKLITKKSAKEIFRDHIYPKLLSTAALAAFVTICVAWIGMLSAFQNEKKPQQTDSYENTFETVLSSEIILSPSESSESNEPTGSSGKEMQTEFSDLTVIIKPSQNETPAPDAFVSPDDETKALYVITRGNAHGVSVKITISGYQSQSLGKEFYVKSNEYIVIDVEVTNKSTKTIYQSVPKECLNADPSHNHRVSLNLSMYSTSHGTYSLCPSTIGYVCSEETASVTLKAGETIKYQLKYAAGEEVAEEFDIPAEGNDYPAGIKLYDKTIYSNNSCVVQGNLSFEYHLFDFTNGYSLDQELSYEIVYVISQTKKD